MRGSNIFQSQLSRNFLNYFYLFSNTINQIKNVSQEKKIKSEIQKDSTALFNLSNNPETQEKFAREKYNMKKDNEDVIIIVESNE